MFSALSCTSCKGGHPVLPVDPTRGDSEWRCTACSRSYPAEHARELNARLDRELEGDDGGGGGGSEDQLARCERILHQFSGAVHPTHKLLIDVQTRLAVGYGCAADGYPLEALTRPQLERKEQCCRQVLDVVARVDPGYTAWRGQVLWELNRATVHAAKRDFAAGLRSREELARVLRDEKCLGVYIAYHQSVLLANEKKRGAASKD